MSYTPSYTKRNYVNNQAPSLNADNLNAIEDAITNLESNAQSYSSKVDTLQNTSATKTELNIAKRELSEDIAFANTAIANEIEAREASEAEIRTEISKVANSNLQTSSDVLDFAMDGNIQSARFEGYARKSKNLLDINNVTVYANTSKVFNVSLPSGTYTFSRRDADSIRLRVTYSDDTYVDVLSWVSTKNVTFTATQNIKAIQINKNQITVDLVAMECQLEIGTTATPYEPYGIIKPSGIIESRTKNFLNCSGIVEQTINGVTFTPKYNKNGQLEYVLVNGTNSTNSSSYYYLNRNIGNLGKNTLLSGCPSGGSSTASTNAYCLQLYAEGVNGSYVDDDGRGNISVDAITLTYAIITVRPNTTCNNLKFYPMVREATVTDTTYEPYGKTEITLPYTPLGINNIHDELIVNADGSGKFIKRIGTVDMGSLNWSASPTSDSTKYRMQTDTITEIKNISASQVGNMLCEKYDNVSSENIYNRQDVGISTNSQVIIAYDTNYNQSGSASSFKSAMNGIILYYEVATPQTINLTASQVAQILALQTFSDTTYVDADGMHYEIGYAQNSAKAIKELQNIIKNLLNPQTEAVDEQITAMSDDEEGEEANV